MDQQQQRFSQHLVLLQNESLKREIEMLKQENAELRSMYNELKQSLDKAVETCRELQSAAVDLANSEPTQDSVDTNVVSEPQHVSERLAEDGCSSEYQDSFGYALWKMNKA